MRRSSSTRGPDLYVTAMRLKALTAVLAFVSGCAANPVLHWTWSYSGEGITAAGTLTTSNAPDNHGYYRIMDITGSRNGQAIAGLQPAGKPIPGNAPYAVDNLISGNGPQLTEHGFGFSLANGDYANPFGKGSGYLEYVSAPPYPDGKGAELPVTFVANVMP